ncbi:hypothetical protein [Paenibacillus sp. Mc5Re-14]|uniref:hypothetical protein n=1 Tax=Paenibacillus sp. Mc5Re-14 TaxID=1030529 RepID=UPI000A9F1EBA|nr:hypothetical protein [Paenibacillus sp. Mc5Re-14]
MMKVTVELNGKTMGDIENAFDEAKRKVLEGYKNGFDSNDSGSYSFEVDGEEEVPKFDVGDSVKVASDNDNDGYDDFRDKTLIVTHVATSTDEHPGYDESMEGIALYDLETEDGEEIGCSLYEYELEET